GDCYVLCSDGLTGMITDEEILDVVVTRESPDEACTELIRRANAHGGEDNVTAIVVRVIEEETDHATDREPVDVDEATEVRPAPVPAPAPADTMDEFATESTGVDIRIHPPPQSPPEPETK